jgi:hypothetical protein
MEMADKFEKPGRKITPIVQFDSKPLYVYNNSAMDEITTTATSFPANMSELNRVLMSGIFLTRAVLVTVLYVVECKVTGGHELKARIVVSNPGSFPCGDSTVVLTTSPNYETRFHMSNFALPSGPNDLNLEWYVTGGTGYLRYRCCTLILTS